MSDHIKSNDLCERCVFDFDRHCLGSICSSCEMFMKNLGVCGCGQIEDNTPCTYFKEAKDNG